MIKIYNQKVEDFEGDGSLFHALLCDPPYHLTTITKRFGKENSAPAQYGSDGAFARLSKGFMGNEWDGGDIAFQPSTWLHLKQFLYPGAFGMAFSSARTVHRMAVAIEDAGFIIHSMIVWIYGSGMPKATRIQTTDRDWKNYRYGLGALKPALEPIIVFQKPYDNNPKSNILTNGAGALGVYNCLIPSEKYKINRWSDGAKPFSGGAGHEYYETESSGRYPANLILSKAVVDSINLNGKYRKSGVLKPEHQHNSKFYFKKSKRETATSQPTYGDSGGVARYFYQVEQALNHSDPFFYSSKANKKERSAGLNCVNNHPTVKPIQLTSYLSKLLLPPKKYSPRKILIPFSGVGSEMIGAGSVGWDHVVGIEADTKNGYVEIAKKRLKHWLGMFYSEA